jgi:hypothetical protein
MKDRRRWYRFVSYSTDVHLPWMPSVMRYLVYQKEIDDQGRYSIEDIYNYLRRSFLKRYADG